MYKKIILNYKGKKIQLELKEMVGPFNEARGLMFSCKKNAKALLFSFKKPTGLSMHSFFVFFKFISIWLDENNKIIEIRKISPWGIGIKPKTKFTKLIEIPINGKYKEIIKLLDED